MRSSRARLIGALVVALSLVAVGSASRVLDDPKSEPAALAGLDADSGAKNPGDTKRSGRWLALAAPNRAQWKPAFTNVNQEHSGLQRSVADEEFPLSALAMHFDAPVFESLEKGRRIIGFVRRGNILAARAIPDSELCYEQGRREPWYETRHGYICGAWHFEVADSEIEMASPHLQPDVSEPLPFTYARVITGGAPRFSRLPTAAEVEQALESDELPSFVAERMVGDFFVALHRVEERDGNRFYRTVSDEFVLEKDLDIRSPSKLFGERLSGEDPLPMAFIYGEEDASVFCLTGDALTKCGAAQKFARFNVEATREIQGKQYVKMGNGRLVERLRVRVAEKARRPGGVPKDGKWVHIDLDQQTLVAYEGERPVYASLVTTGKETHKTPTGLYRAQRKYISKTMRDTDPVEGIYHVEEVPWTLFYYGGYAVHGAYWHDTFGSTRSHGCTNLAPADARWIYHWDTIDVPPSWQAVAERQGTWFHFTSDASTG